MAGERSSSTTGSVAPSLVVVVVARPVGTASFDSHPLALGLLDLRHLVNVRVHVRLGLRHLAHVREVCMRSALVVSPSLGSGLPPLPLGEYSYKYCNSLGKIS